MEGYLGEIRLFGGSFAPKNWAYCNGAIIPITGNEALYAILGMQFGGNGQTNFGLPDLLSRTAIGAGQSPGTSLYPVGNKTGTTTVTLDVTQIPPHVHMVTSNLTGNFKLQCNADSASTDDPDSAYPAIADSGTPYSPTIDAAMAQMPITVTKETVTCNDTGGGQAHNNMQPYLVTSYIICIKGDFPARN
ncbi:MAG: tail fiber protein [Flavipsychrobacter sp.]